MSIQGSRCMVLRASARPAEPSGFLFRALARRG